MRLGEKKNAAELAFAEGSSFDDPGEHVASEHAALRVGSAEVASRCVAQIRVNFVVRRRNIELCIAPERIFRKKCPVVGFGDAFRLCPRKTAQNHRQQNPEQSPSHCASASCEWIELESKQLTR